MPKSSRILVIKLGAIGDIFFIFAALQSIHKAYPKASFSFFTRKPHGDLVKPLGIFHHIYEHSYPRIHRFGLRINDNRALKKLLRQRDFDMVFDFQGMQKRVFFSSVFQAKEWHFIDPHQYNSQEHPNQACARQMQDIGIKTPILPEMGWLQKTKTPPSLSFPYALLVLGGTLWRKNKLWPLDNFIALAQWLVKEKNLIPVLLGGKQEKAKGTKIIKACKQAVDLTGQLSIYQAALLGKETRCAFGHDTGLMHLLAFDGVTCFILIRDKIFNGHRALKRDHVSFFHKKRVDMISFDHIKRMLDNHL